MKKRFFRTKMAWMLIYDALLIALALYLSYAIRFEFDIPAYFLNQARFLVLWLVPSKLLLLYLFGCYHRMWRYTSVLDIVRLVQAMLIAAVINIAIIGMFFHFAMFSRAVALLENVLSIILLVIARLAFRVYFIHRSAFQLHSLRDWVQYLFSFRRHENHTLIVGTSAHVESLLRESLRIPEFSQGFLGILTTDNRDVGRAIHGISILGTVKDIERVISKFPVQKVFVSTPGISSSDLRVSIETCEKRQIVCKKLPDLGSIINGKVSVKDLRDINYEDLLGRPPVCLDTEGIRSYIGGRNVLVTGAGGSIGSELCRQLIVFEPDNLILIENCEANLFNIHMQLENEYGFSNVIPALGSIQDVGFLSGVFKRYRPEVVFHAAAYKHVPLMEVNPWQTVCNNILGSYRVMACSREHHVRRFVLVSTDKAVRPTNVMGASKRVVELVLHCLNADQGKENRTTFQAVRFGNVVGSSGSVVPLFRKQIARGGPVTVTHPEVTRYFMTIPEAAQLILQAGALGEGGEIFILKMGTQVKIVDMARDLIKLSGKEPETEVPIEIIGLRPGEKLYEELITEGESIVETQHNDIMMLRPEDDPVPRALSESLEETLDHLHFLAQQHQGDKIKKKISELVPEYRPRQHDAVI